MAVQYHELTDRHPCFALRGRGTKGRIHLPVSPACNIQCRFCIRSLNETENRPGVTSAILEPEEAVSAVGKALELCPEITVAGIAGPGDTLATDHALQTFRLIGREYPSLIKCMSTNGLLLPEKVEEILDLGIDSLTVTVNAVDAKILSRLNQGIFYHGEYCGGEEAAGILIENQLRGIEAVAKGGVTVKVNTVLVPDINGSHIEAIAETVSRRGASIYNIIPLIPQHQLSGERAPSCEEIDAARQKAEPYIDVFRHCQRCRADAAGIPGVSDFGLQIYQKRIQQEETFSHG